MCATPPASTPAVSPPPAFFEELHVRRPRGKKRRRPRRRFSSAPDDDSATLEEPQDTMVCQFVGHLSSNFVRLRQQMNRGPGTEQQPIQCRPWLSSAGHKLRHGVLVFRQSLRGVRSRKGWPRAEVTSPWA